MKKTEYAVDLESHGRGGWILYNEGELEFRLAWEIAPPNGFHIFIPAAEDWDSYCLNNNAKAAVGRRDAFLARMAKRIAKRLFWFGGRYEIANTSIQVFPRLSLLS